MCRRTGKIRRALRSFCLVLLALTAGGCVSTAINIEQASSSAAAQEQASVVFGRIEWLENGQEKKIGNGILSMSISPHLLRMEDRKRIAGEVGEGGDFVWRLPKGTYLIHKIAYRDAWSGNYFFVPKVAFAVPENGKTYYIGLLRAEFSPERDLLGGLSGTGSFTVRDESEGGFADFQSRLGAPPEKIDRSLMVHDPSLPRTVETTAEFNLAMTILGAIL